MSLFLTEEGILPAVCLVAGPVAGSTEGLPVYLACSVADRWGMAEEKWLDAAEEASKRLVEAAWQLLWG